MKTIIFAAAISVSLAAPAFAQVTRVTPPSGNSNSIIRTPDTGSSGGAGAGASGNVGSPGPTYPNRLRDYNSPSTQFGIGTRPLNLPRR
ncbi:hypothetical protein [Hyphomicrobium sp.]|uniref:hypothetical protein n=1 Tax=Hyphomicrobium sp. TaxID=82 RepID=UPI002D766461|nr:hypothetical protein [Hyphomicrobium sp.]HET6387736.1 hypothetical protein [Hyphomicrobium sp.]